MTCNFGNDRRGNSVIFCTANKCGRLHVENKYYYVEFHNWLGPTFYSDQYQTVYEPSDENDPIWPAFMKWFDKSFARKGERESE